MKIDHQLTAAKLAGAAERVFACSGAKILDLASTWNPAHGTPVFTINGRYATRGWTEWTQGFQYGAALLQFDATGERAFLDLGRRQTRTRMAPHLSHVGVHDHGFNNVSTYGTLWRLITEGRIDASAEETEYYVLALKVSGAVQAARWTALPEGGYIYSFNGPHSLFIDTLRSLRSLALAHQFGHVLMGERDRPISLLQRLLVHGRLTARYAVYFGSGRDAYDVRGRVAHESLFNTNDGSYRCPNSQQGYSPFSTWTRGLAWALLGFAEQCEFLATLPSEALLAGAVPSAKKGRKARASAAAQPDFASDPRILFLEAARAAADFYIEHTCLDGIPMWDTGAPNLHHLGAYWEKASDPFNLWEPVDASAAAIAAQGLLRLGQTLSRLGDRALGRRYWQAGLTVARTLMDEPYLAERGRHQGLLLHSVYHRPNGWDHIRRGQKIPNQESSMWGDYHLRELALLLLREAKRGIPLRFFGPDPG